ncbi:hypothetical protein [Propionivibrio sp.]|uniref:hypothetical protein n=1 Tax=Propionivibrio sp. TaxID=2212460 RepID=UPI0025D32D63|nr:hypothetical protein [Propionivibrio sp.]MBK7357118.1 hypothetical protein [Propionivibrio sp.]
MLAIEILVVDRRCEIAQSQLNERRDGKGFIWALSGFQRLKVVAAGRTDMSRARQFYGETLALPPAYGGDRQVGHAGKHHIDVEVSRRWLDAQPSGQLNPRITLATTTRT